MKSWLTTEGYLNADVYIDRSLPPTMRTSITVQFQIENSRNYHTLFNYDVDTCQSVKSHTAGSLPSLWFRNVRKYGNLSAICPMKAVGGSPFQEGTELMIFIFQGYYDLRNFHVEDKSIPVYLRPGNYRIQDTNYYGKNNAKARQRRLVSTIILQMQLYWSCFQSKSLWASLYLTELWAMWVGLTSFLRPSLLRLRESRFPPRFPLFDFRLHYAKSIHNLKLKVC